MLGSFRWRDSPDWWKRHSLSLFLAAVLAAQVALYTATAWQDWQAEQQAHGQAVDLAGFAVWWATEVNLSTLADTYGALLLVLASKFFYEQGSAESKE